MTAPLLDNDLLTDQEIETGPPRERHYWRNLDILNGMMFGTPAVALCGVKRVPSKDGDSLPICPRCKELFENPEHMSIIHLDN